MTNYKKKKSKRIFNCGCCSLLLRFRWEKISFKSVCTLTQNNILCCSLQIAFRARPVWRRASYWTSDVFKENLTHFTYRESCQHNYIPPKPVQLAFAFVMEYDIGENCEGGLIPPPMEKWFTCKNIVKNVHIKYLYYSD